MKGTRITVWLLVAVLIAMMTTPALAVPDRMTTYMLQNIQTGITPERNYRFWIGNDTRWGNAVRQSIFDQMEYQQIFPIEWWELDWFGQPEKQQAQALTHGNVESMTLSEFVSIWVEGYDEPFGEEQAIFQFVSKYPLDMEFVAIVGVLKDGTEGNYPDAVPIDSKAFYDWQALCAEPTEDGIKVYFTVEALKRVNGKDAVLALLCNPGAQGYREEPAVLPGAPSKTVDDITSVRIENHNGNDKLYLRITRQMNEQQIWTEYARLYQFIVYDKQLPIHYFDENIVNEIKGMLPENVDVLTLEMNEFLGLAAYNYDYRHGEVTVDLSVPSQYWAGQSVVAVAGAFNEDGVPVWTPQRGEVVEGKIRVHFTQNIMTRMEEDLIALMILSEQPK